MHNTDSISHYDYSLPPELIAQHPMPRRDSSRLLVLNREHQTLSHHHFSDLPDLLAHHDLLVMNDTRVVPARLNGTRTATGGKWEGLFLREAEEGGWRIIGKTRGTLLPGETISLERNSHSSHSESEPSRLVLVLESRQAGGEWIVRPVSSSPTLRLLDEFGSLPLPHYMQREADSTDDDRYQTTYADRPGAVAAPTAGLHFTPELLNSCATRGIQSTRVTLHVGLGTFRPVNVEQLNDHQMHYEWCQLPAEALERIQQTRQRQGRIVAVGTTSVRTLETAALSGPLQPWEGETNLFIRPPFPFQVTDALITNFHLPKSTLLVLVSAFAGRDFVLGAYEEAIRERYRFFSYGDAMLIL